MKKHVKILFAFVLTLIMCLSSIPVFASESDTGISPRLSHMSGARFAFSASEEGGQIAVIYEGYESFAQAKVTIKLQKRFLLLFWSDVDEWSSTSTDMFGEFYHTFTLNGKGTYKATMTLEVKGTDGTVDVITDSIESTY